MKEPRSDTGPGNPIRQQRGGGAADLPVAAPLDRPQRFQRHLHRRAGRRPHSLPRRLEQEQDPLRGRLRQPRGRRLERHARPSFRIEGRGRFADRLGGLGGARAWRPFASRPGPRRPCTRIGSSMRPGAGPRRRRRKEDDDDRRQERGPDSGNVPLKPVTEEGPAQREGWHRRGFASASGRSRRQVPPRRDRQARIDPGRKCVKRHAPPRSAGSCRSPRACGRRDDVRVGSAAGNLATIGPARCSRRAG